MKSNKKVYFNDDGEEVSTKNKTENEVKSNSKIYFDENDGMQIKNTNNLKSKKHQSSTSENLEKRWFQLFEDYNISEEKSDMKDCELMVLQNLCKSCFEEESQKQLKNNPSDAKWLETALHKGTSKDRANAGALLVQTNPISNLSALESLINLAKLSNKSCVDVLEIITELFKNSLLPNYRKLIQLPNRGSDWKRLKNDSELDKSTKDKIYAYWHFENELKELFHAFLLNIQANLQNGKEPNKIKAIISASNLLKSCPEKESFVLTMIVNKFGDPNKKIASKATYNLNQILHVHPNMANVVIMETEKLIFRNNITELAQHIGIGFLSMIARLANVEASQRLINICFSFFKIKIEKGDINSKTMQSILNCLRVAIKNINDLNEEKKKIEIATPDVVNTIYRVIYMSNISIAFQGLSLLFQLVLVQENENHDRFYNALYKKMSDLEIINANNKITSLYFHILHYSIQEDKNSNRAKAFLKRLLQMAQAFPPAKACGALIIMDKIIISRPELASFNLYTTTTSKVTDEMKAKYKLNKNLEEDDYDDGEEIYKDVLLDEMGNEIKQENVNTKDNDVKPKFSWMHVRNVDQDRNDNKNGINKKEEIKNYDPYKRSAAFCGVDYTMYYELIQLSKHFHPTVQVFCENILKRKNIKYYGDPLRDFSLSHFLDRFAFKNPKKIEKKADSLSKKIYQPKGSRGLSVHLLTEQNCTEDEKFIFEFLQKKRVIKEEKIKRDDSDVESVDDDEFDAYLDSLGVAGGDKNEIDADFDYISELQNDSANMDKKAKKKEKKEESSAEAIDDWDSEEDHDHEIVDGDDYSDDDQSISLDERSESEPELSDDEDLISENSEDAGENKKSMNSKTKAKSFKEKLNENDMNSLFVAVDDFSEMIEENARKGEKHGTLGEIFNKDKSSQKQLNWEEKRHSSGGFKRKGNSTKNFNVKKKSRK